MYEKVSPQDRPRIPRLKGSRRILECVERTNSVIKSRIQDHSSIEDLIDCVYAGAITVCEENCIRLCDKEFKPKEEKIPPWRTRLERKINNIRKTIGTLHTYLNNNSPTRKIVKRVSRIASQHHIESHNEQLRQKLIILSDTLKQKIKALGNRIRRYNERVKRYKNNQLFYKNPKQFYRTLEGTSADNKTYPTPESIHTTWKEIWSYSGDHDDEAFWIKEAEAESNKYVMEQIIITGQDIKTVLKKTNNWSAPGPDAIHNYWWKYFDSTHNHLAKLFQEALKNPSIIPESCTLGITHMLPKGTNNEDPKNYRPITCLPTIYKILTGILTQKLWRHVGRYNIMAREQNGCRKDAKGCKELLIIDTIITKQAKKKQRNLSMAWIDYKKAYDSIPHSWLKKVLRLYGVSETIINLLEHLMGTWRTRLHVNTDRGDYTTEEIKIMRGIFQGDKLSTLWFCLAINLLSKLLNASKYGYVIEKRNNTRINHHLYIDDLKLYAANEEQLMRELKIVASFTETIKMEMGLDKCAVLHVKRGKLTEGEAMKVQDQITIQTLGPERTYKYLGIQQGLEIRNSEVKIIFKEKFINRLKKILQSKLNSKAMFTSISTWVVPCLAYSFGIIKWSTTDLKALDTQVRGLLTRYGIHHPNASVNRLYIPRKDGGRGLQNIETTHYNTVKEMREYFKSKDSPFFKALSAEDNNITTLNLSSNSDPPAPPSIQELSEVWQGRALHGRFPTVLKHRKIDRDRSLTYLKAGYLFPETEGRLTAIQDQVVATRAYLKNIIGKNMTTDKCRKCSQSPETIQHVTSSCSILAPREYTDRHNAMAKAYHQAIAKKHGLLETTRPIYEYLPKEILENEEVKLYWDHPLITDRSIPHNRPDIVLFEKKLKKLIIADVTIPADDNIERAYTEKIMKYHDLSFELKEIYGLTYSTILPLVITTNGLVETHLLENTMKLGLDESVIGDAQKEVILWTTRIVRRFLTSN
ncbi:uncharacterized protein LOC123322418 [Coccinella septempunctata]|uniref:uncharacterized protein LOC123322418 n=1 Tax=Coccinella septempunctata TaxID=41139 RepID=UPI001D08ABEC|nr:uncharacterized protein LOC123322418 [Coccinella septempunctata]